MIKKVAFSAIVMALATGCALAADLPSRKAEPAYLPPPPPPPLWSGFYVGLNAGGAFSTNNQASTASYPLSDSLAAGVNALDPSALPPPFSVKGPWFLRSGLIPGGTALANTGISNVNQGGFVGGGQVGYNYQINAFVVGLEADIQGSTVSGSGSYAGAFADTAYVDRPTGTYRFLKTDRTAIGAGGVQAGVDWFGTVRGRLGYLVTPTILAYATGGLAYGGVHASTRNLLAGTVSASTETAGEGVAPTSTLATPGLGNLSRTNVGWTVGGGFEWMFTNAWSLKAEALYYNLGSATVLGSPMTASTPGPVNFTAATGVPLFPFVQLPVSPAGAPLVTNVPATKANFNGVIVRAGVNYHFNWGSAAPVLARY